MSQDLAVAAPRNTRIVLIAVVVLGVGAQMLQRADPTFFLLYFTVHAALLCGLAQGALLMGGRPTVWEAVRDASCVAVLLSALVYLMVILPNRTLSLSDGAVAWIGTLCLHGVLPILAVADFLRSDRKRKPRSSDVFRAWILFPVGYLFFVAVLGGTGMAPPPYDFLRPGSVGWGLVALSCVVIAGLFVALGLVLVVVHRCLNRPPPD